MTTLEFIQTKQRLNAYCLYDDLLIAELEVKKESGLLTNQEKHQLFILKNKLLSKAPTNHSAGGGVGSKYQ